MSTTSVADSVTSFNVDSIRRDFPILNKPLPKGIPLVYLDNAASAQKPSAVIEREREVYENFYANAYRGVYRFGAQVDEEFEATREKVRQLIHAGSTEEIVFTAGTTAAINLVAAGWGRRFLRPGDDGISKFEQLGRCRGSAAQRAHLHTA